jgi:uracil-DNA glycosylase
MKLTVDEPMSLRDLAVCRERLAAIREPHISPLTNLVESIRRDRGVVAEVPYFDPTDGGINAMCLFLLEAPGAKAVASGFVSRNNPDQTAKNFFLLNQDAGLARELTVSWNIVPWYIGDGGSIRSASASDVEEGSRYLSALLALLPRLDLVVLIGRKAQTAALHIQKAVPQAIVLDMLHPSPRVVNRLPCNRAIMLSTLKAARQILDSRNRQMPTLER